MNLITSKTLPSQRRVLHLDADAFFASVEQAADPRLRGKPVAVGGDKRGIIASASYEARQLGVVTPMPTARARKLCPKLIVLPGDYEKYEQFSEWMFSYAYDFTPDVEVTSIDEGYMDVTGARKPALEIAETLRQAIRQALKITVSEGIGTSKLISQIASKLHKPAAFAEVNPGQEIPFLHPLINRWLPGIGPKVGGQLDAAGLARVGQIAATPLELLHLVLGNQAREVLQFANGVDERPVITNRVAAKSYGQQQTFGADTTDEEYVEAVLRRMADELMARAREDGHSVRTLTVKVRYNDMSEDQAGESLLEPTDLETDIYGRLRLLLKQAWRRRVSLRLVSLKLSNLHARVLRVSLPLDPQDRGAAARQRLAQAIDTLRRERGDGVILRGHDFRLREGPTTQAPAAPAPSPADPTSARVRLLTVGGPLRPAPHAASTVRVSVARPRRVVAAYVPLGVRSYYSFLDSTLSVEAIVAWAKAADAPAVAMADHGNLHGAVALARAAQEAGIKALAGARVRLEGEWVTLYAQNQQGYRNLCRWVSTPGGVAGGNGAFADADSGTSPRIKGNGLKGENEGLRGWSWDQVAGLSDGLLVIGGGNGGRGWERGGVWEMRFPGRWYRALETDRDLREAVRRPTDPWVACMPVHYAAVADRWKYDVVQSIRTRTLLRQAHAEKRLDGEYHLRSMAEMRTLMKSCPDALARTVELADRCEFQMPFGKPSFPAFVPPDGSTAPEFLRRLVEEGVRRRYPGRETSVRRQVEEELGIIEEVGYQEYFLVMWDLLQACRERGIEWITRGSAADSLVCYCLGISGVCPVRFDLYFRRFLNRDRMQLNKLPDIDIDFPHDRKDDVIDLVFAKYGRAHAAAVGGFSTYQARGAFGDVAKVLGVSEFQVRRFTEHFPWSGSKGLAALLEQNVECRHLPLKEEPYSTALAMAEFLDGFPRYAKMHPCGVVLSRGLMADTAPVFQSRKGYPTTHYDMDSVEMIGLVKTDILAQGGLAVMRDVQRTLQARGVSVDLERCVVVNGSGADGLVREALAPYAAGPAREAVAAVSRTMPGRGRAARGEVWEDPEVWRMIASGNARAVHHIESPAMVSLCRMCQVGEIDGLVAIVSVIRPGAANENKKVRFTRRYQGLEPVEYPHPSLEPCLRSTFGLVVYEEHILQICEAFAGLSPGRADVLRRALGKHKLEIIETIRLEFFDSARALGREESNIAQVWDLVSGFAGYAFCKAHSTAYGVEAYQSAWLKRYFPVEFMAAVLTHGKGFYDPLVYVLECHRLGIRFLPPWVNQPGPAFEVCEGAIRVPATRVRGVGDELAARMAAEARRTPFQSVRDFYLRTHPSTDAMEALVMAGALDGFGLSRTALYWECRYLSRAFATAESTEQGWLIPPPGVADALKMPRQEPGLMERLRWETDLLGFCVSRHPLELHRNVAWDTYCPVARLGEHVGRTVVVCGLVIEQRVHHQVTGEPMKFLTLADWTGMVETELFAPTYRSYGLATIRYPVLEIEATVEPYENGQGHSLRVLRAGKPRFVQEPTARIASWDVLGLRTPSP